MIRWADLRVFSPESYKEVVFEKGCTKSKSAISHVKNNLFHFVRWCHDVSHLVALLPWLSLYLFHSPLHRIRSGRLSSPVPKALGCLSAWLELERLEASPSLALNGTWVTFIPISGAKRRAGRSSQQDTSSPGVEADYFSAGPVSHLACSHRRRACTYGQLFKVILLQAAS